MECTGCGGTIKPCPVATEEYPEDDFHLTLGCRGYVHADGIHICTSNGVASPPGYEPGPWTREHQL